MEENCFYQQLFLQVINRNEIGLSFKNNVKRIQINNRYLYIIFIGIESSHKYTYRIYKIFRRQWKK